MPESDDLLSHFISRVIAYSPCLSYMHIEQDGPFILSSDSQMYHIRRKNSPIKNCLDNVMLPKYSQTLKSLTSYVFKQRCDSDENGA